MGLLFCASDLELHRATRGKFRRSRQGEYLSMECGEIATKIALKPTQVDVKHTQTDSCEGKFLNLCLSMRLTEKGACLRPQGLQKVGQYNVPSCFPFVVFWKEEAPTALRGLSAYLEQT
jgi:hypothetical protein